MSNLKEEAQLNNFAAHKAKVLSELADANTALSAVLVLIENANANLSGILKKIEAAKNKLARTEALAAEKLRQCNEKIKQITKLTRDLEKGIKDFEEYKTEELTTIARDRAASEAVVARHKEENAQMLLKIADTRSKLATVTTELESGQAQLEAMYEDERVLRTTITELQSEKVMLEHDITEEKEALAYAEELVRAELAKIELPSQSLARDAAEIRKRERNVKVMTARLQKAHAKLYPGKILKI